MTSSNAQKVVRTRVPAACIELAGRTDIGQRRKRNEDSWACVGDRGLAVVADGMGGRPLGQVASERCTSTIVEHIRGTAAVVPDPRVDADARLSDDERALLKAIRASNHAVCSVAADLVGREDGMGTTVVAALFAADGQTVSIAHVGDSRCYRVRAGSAELLTRDHTMANELADRAAWLPPEAIANVPRHVLARAIGLRREVPIDLLTEEVRPGDVYMLCSDGMWGRVEDDEIALVVSEAPDLDAACERLVALANGRGGPDNITVVLARVPTGPTPRRSGLALRAVRADEGSDDGGAALDW